MHKGSQNVFHITITLCLPVKGGTLMLFPMEEDVWLLVKSDIVDIFDVEMAPSSGGGDPFMLDDIFMSWIIHHR